MFLQARFPLRLRTTMTRALLLLLLLLSATLSGFGAAPAWGAAETETAALWLAMEGASQAPEASAGTLLRLDPATGGVLESLVSPAPGALTLDATGAAWLATSDGLWRTVGEPGALRLERVEGAGPAEPTEQPASGDSNSGKPGDGADPASPPAPQALAFVPGIGDGHEGGSIWWARGEELSIFDAAGQLLVEETLDAPIRELLWDEAAALVWVTTDASVFALEPAGAVAVLRLDVPKGFEPRSSTAVASTAGAGAGEIWVRGATADADAGAFRIPGVVRFAGESGAALGAADLAFEAVTGPGSERLLADGLGGAWWSDGDGLRRVELLEVDGVARLASIVEVLRPFGAEAPTALVVDSATRSLWAGGPGGVLRLSPAGETLATWGMDANSTVVGLAWTGLTEDERPPTLNILAPTEGSKVEADEVMLELAASDPDSGIDWESLELRVEGVPLDSVCEPAGFDPVGGRVCPLELPLGPADVRARVWDFAGLASEEAIVRFTLVEPEPGDDGADDPLGTPSPFTPTRNDRGVEPNKVYLSDGDVETISTDSGHLTLAVPLGQRYGVGAQLSYQFRLVHNSNVWQPIQLRCEGSLCDVLPSSVQFASTNPSANAGLGWEIHFGKLYAPTAPSGLSTLEQDLYPNRPSPSDVSSQWLYVAPDGSRHELKSLTDWDNGTASRPVRYSTDSSQLRMLQTHDDKIRIEYPDGTFALFTQTDEVAGTEFCGGAAGGTGCWRFRKLQDPYGNKITADYSLAGSVETWTIADSTGRSHELVFSRAAAERGGGDGVVLGQGNYTFEGDEWGDLRRILTAVRLDTFGGGTSTYSFVYRTAGNVIRGCPHDTQEIPGGYATLTSRVLEQILTPEGESWAFGSNTPAGSPSGSSCNTTAGTLAWMRLPSGGRVDYGYGPWTFPTRCNYRASVDPGDDLTYVKAGVRTKTRTYADGSVDPPWTYASALVGGGATYGPNCERAGYRKTTVDGPEAGGLFTRQTFYSSVTEGSQDPTVYQSISGHQVTDAGLPFAKPLSIGGSASAQRYLSRETFECTSTASCTKLRSVYVRYASAFRAPDAGQGRSLDCDKALGDGPDCFVLNPRLTAQRTVYHGDANRWSEQRWRDFNGAGTARIEEASDSWSGLNRRVSTTTLPTGGTTLGENAATGYLAVGTPSSYLPSPASDWLLHTWSRRTVQEAGISHVTEATFNTKGSLTCERRWKNGGSRSGQDLVRSLTYGASVGLNAGLPTLEILAGGDDAFLSTGTVCSTSGSTLAGTRFQIQHGYQHLTPSSTQMAGGFPYSFNATIDRNTGRVKRSFDVAGQWADFEYDDLGRLTAVRPEAALNEADTLISYQVSLPTPPVITTSRVSGGQTLSWSRAKLDGFGQVVEEQRRRPTNASGAFTLSARNSFYDPYGRLKKTTTWQDAGSVVDSHATRYRGYDPFGRARLVLAADGQQTTVAYQGERRTCTTADVRTSASGSSAVTSCTEADGLGRTTRDTNPSYETRYTYDPAGQLLTAFRLSGGNSQPRSWTRDGRGFLTSESLPELAGRPITYRRDALGAVREHYDGQRTRRWSYDSGARPTELRVDGALWEEFAWGTANVGNNKSLGKLVEARRWNRPFGGAPWVVVERYAYAGALGQVSRRETQLHFPDNPIATQWGEYFETGWSHDPLGRPTSIDYPRCLPSPQNGHIECNDSPADTPAPPIQVQRTYQHDQLVAVDGGGLLMGAAYQYHPNLQLAEATYDSGTRFLADRGTNGMGRPARLRVVSPTGSTWFDTGTYQYDPAGHIWAIGTDRYTYDPAGRLKTATVAQAGSGRSEAYTYDPFDNLLSVAQDSHPINLYQVDAPSNRLRGVAGQSPDIFYDLAGNMTAVGFTLAGTPVFEQGYDALNMAESFLYRNDISGAVTSHYLYLYGPGNRRLMTFDAQTTERVVTLRDLAGTPLREFSVTGWGPTAHWRYTHDYVSGPEGTFARRAANGVRRYLHRDHLGSLRLLSSGSPHNAIETGRHHYYPFGTPAYASGNDAPKSKYTGHERDPHGAADYMMGRTCVFPFQRFMSVDPGRDGWNLYAYVGNDPVRFLDPSGNERAQIWLDQDVDRFLAGEITREEYHSNLRARGTGALAATSLFVPGPEDVLLAGLAVRFGGRLLGGARRLGARLFGKADDAAKAPMGQTSRGIGVTRHGVNQKINRGVRSADELDAVRNPLDTRPVKVDELGRPSQRVVGRNAEVVRNPETGDIISVNPTSTKKAERLLRRLKDR